MSQARPISVHFPTIILSPDVRDHLLWLGVANSLAMDFLVRKKVSLKMSYTIMDSLPFPRDFQSTPFSSEIVHRTCALCAVGPEMQAFREAALDAGILSSLDEVVEDLDRRAVLAAEIDVLVAREVYGLGKNEMLYILDPVNILGEDCGIETFKALRNREYREFNEFRTQRLIEEAWDRLTIAETRPAPADLPDGAWARATQQPHDAGAALTAILKAIDGPTPREAIRFAAALVLEPHLLTALLPAAQAQQWRRLNGQEAEPRTGNVFGFAARTNQGWGTSVSNHRGNGRLIEDLSTGTWAPGPGLDVFDTTGWPDGRAHFVLEALRSLDLASTVSFMPDEVRDWIAHAAAA